MRTGSWLLAAVALLFGVARASGVFEATLLARVKAPKGSEFNRPTKTSCTITLRGDSAQFGLGQHTLLLQSRPTKVVVQHHIVLRFLRLKKNANGRLTLHYTKEGYEITLFGTPLALEGISTFLSNPDPPQTPAPTITAANQEEEEPAPVDRPEAINSDPGLELQTPAPTITTASQEEEPALVNGPESIDSDPDLGLGCWDGHIAGAVIGTVGTLFLLLYMYLAEHVFGWGYSIS